MKDVIEEFFQKNSDNWRDNYPGLSLKRLQQEFQHYTGCVGEQYEKQTYLETPGPYWDNFTSFLKNGVPLQYISRQAYFYKSEFFVDERVLIPRSETEILVERALEFIKSYSKDDLLIYEVGVGSGCIGLSLLQELNSKKVSYLGTDISEEALEVFEINLFRHQFKISKEYRVNTLLADRLEGIKIPADVILSNPPYIKETLDRKLVHGQVKKFEPQKALFLQDELYDDWFEQFFTEANSLLKKGGLFLMEGHEKHLSRLEKMAQKIFAHGSELITDYTGRERFLKIIKS